jgi:pimeloyl-ACP methyl ester carboxylesterase
MDRRGRGGSGDSRAYDLQREAEDVAAVVEAIGEPVNVLGHSYGGLCALEATLLTPLVRRLITYESVPLRGENDVRSSSVDKLEAMLGAGDVETMLVAMLEEVVEMPAAEVETMRSQRDAWAIRLANAPTIPRELRAHERYVFRPERFKSMRTPTLLLVGEQSPPRELANAQAIAEALPLARVELLPGQQHIAMHTAPEIFVNAVVTFLTAP